MAPLRRPWPWMTPLLRNVAATACGPCESKPPRSALLPNCTSLVARTLYSPMLTLNEGPIVSTVFRLTSGPAGSRCRLATSTRTSLGMRTERQTIPSYATQRRQMVRRPVKNSGSDGYLRPMLQHDTPNSIKRNIWPLAQIPSSSIGPMLTLISGAPLRATTGEDIPSGIHGLAHIRRVSHLHAQTQSVQHPM
ncbi:hypothetical protein BDY17DRAFT_174919 [Neohortaea acidophila]|uniref:Uncharacterized protein n=1 Tax=Neohortaea acidophila TaxID=245834 RepID=A0A6A6PQL8_9PEZI|nr:uncharacterized protein BDY17DRAFT_174919 [Neohortaea acidophila]KAF2481981.1 hypothetical protein BDY17DRAFT_174919 [Neohortaea acidophila]